MTEKPTFPVSVSGDDYEWVEAEIMDYLEVSSKYDEAVRENKTLRMTWFNHDSDDRSKGHFNLISAVDGDLQNCEGPMAKSIVGFECDQCPDKPGDEELEEYGATKYFGYGYRDGTGPHGRGMGPGGGEGCDGEFAEEYGATKYFDYPRDHCLACGASLVEARRENGLTPLLKCPECHINFHSPEYARLKREAGEWKTGSKTTFRGRGEEYGSVVSKIKNSSAKPYIISGLVSLVVAIVVASVAKK